MTRKRNIVLGAVAAALCGCGLVGAVDEGLPPVQPYVEVVMASGEHFEVPQVGVWAYHDVPPKRWGRHTDLTLNLSLVGDLRTFAMLVSVPPGTPASSSLTSRWSILPTSAYAWLRLNDRDGQNVLLAESGQFDVQRSVEDDGAEYVQVAGADLVFSDACGASLTMSSFRGAFRVGEDDLLNKFTPELLEDIATIDEGAGDGSTIQVDGMKQHEGSIGIYREGGGQGVLSYVASFPDVCGTQLSGVFATFPFDPSLQVVRTASSVVLTYDDPSAPDGFDFWVSDVRVAYTIEHWPSAPGDYATFDLVGPITVYRARIVDDALELDFTRSRLLETLRITADLDADCRPGSCD